MTTSSIIPEVPPIPEPPEFVPTPPMPENPRFPEITPENDPTPLTFPQETPPGKFATLYLHINQVSNAV
ncbi:hypothetical protein [Dyadobacter sp. NIV53]|uniref:hypothetical protein n=1 Tax=Dyadobacter sp. NIV53 TaxID=2861765 RepID=UPI001C8807BA|nr:hypothetical protein [Dyadobacter sp. NIV53]